MVDTDIVFFLCVFFKEFMKRILVKMKVKSDNSGLNHRRNRVKQLLFATVFHSLALSVSAYEFFDLQTCL